MTSDEPMTDWERDCSHWRGRVLTGKHSHYCFEWDGLPMDESCEMEWPCACCTNGKCGVPTA